MSRDFWRGVVVGTLVIGTLAAVMSPRRGAVGREAAETAGRLMRRGSRIARRGSRQVLQRAGEAWDRSRSVGRQLAETVTGR